jgi:hypothetical protein
VPIVVAVHKEESSDGTHKHIASVKTKADVVYTRAEVVKSLDGGNAWTTEGTDGSSAKIHKATYCPHGSCTLGPYITTAPDHTTKNNLDNLPTY